MPGIAVCGAVPVVVDMADAVPARADGTLRQPSHHGWRRRVRAGRLLRVCLLAWTLSMWQERCRLYLDYVIVCVLGHWIYSHRRACRRW